MKTIGYQKNIFRVAAFGAAGFGLGGLMYGLAVQFPPEDTICLLFTFLGFLAQAAIGGFALGFALRASWHKTLTLALHVTLGFLGGRFLLILPFAIVMGDHFGGNPPESYFVNLLLGGVSGVGAGVGISLGSGIKRGMFKLIIAGGIGFGLGMLLTTLLYFGLTPRHWLGYMIAGIIGGGVLGAAVGSVYQVRFTDE